jgi:protein involved in polysaccharide export with SLBB domain
MIFYRLSRSLGLILAASVAVFAAGPQAGSAGYRLFARDLIHIAVRNEPDAAGDQRIDAAGEVNVPLVGPVKVAGLSINEAQALVAKRYVDAEIFIHPEVAINVVEYAPKEVMVLGQVGKQGKFTFPPEASTISIVEAITGAGGLTRIAKGDGVKVTRKETDGVEQSFTVNVEKLIEGRATPADAFLLQPGDVVFVPERVF